MSSLIGIIDAAQCSKLSTSSHNNGIFLMIAN
jgi:hypothetical protein